MILRFFTFAMAVLLGGLPVLGQQKGCTLGDGNWIQKICFGNVQSAPTYGHEVLGDTPEWDEFTVFYGKGVTARVDGSRDSKTVSQTNHVFEDISPRLIDVDGDGKLDAVVVQSSFSKGARLAVFKLLPELKLLTATPYIGTPYRWLAPIGAADFNGDGDIDLAYVDRPHLAKALRVWTYRAGGLHEIASISGVTNHKIGENFITSSIRTCNDRPEMVLTDGTRKNIVAVFFQNDALAFQKLGRYTKVKSVTEPPNC